MSAHGRASSRSQVEAGVASYKDQCGSSVTERLEKTKTACRQHREEPTPGLKVGHDGCSSWKNSDRVWRGRDK